MKFWNILSYLGNVHGHYRHMSWRQMPSTTFHPIHRPSSPQLHLYTDETHVSHLFIVEEDMPALSPESITRLFSTLHWQYGLAPQEARRTTSWFVQVTGCMMYGLWNPPLPTVLQGSLLHPLNLFLASRPSHYVVLKDENDFTPDRCVLNPIYLCAWHQLVSS